MPLARPLGPSHSPWEAPHHQDAPPFPSPSPSCYPNQTNSWGLIWEQCHWNTVRHIIIWWWRAGLIPNTHKCFICQEWDSSDRCVHGVPSPQHLASSCSHFFSAISCQSSGRWRGGGWVIAAAILVFSPQNTLSRNTRDSSSDIGPLHWWASWRGCCLHIHLAST